MAPASREAGHLAIGCDFSIELVRIAAKQMGLQSQAADAMSLPYRDGIFDAALSIAVLHHVSTLERRQLLVAETLRVLRPGGVALFYAWAAEQSDGRSGHEFESSDVFVPFHSRVPAAARSGKRTERGGRGDVAVAGGTAVDKSQAAPSTSDAPGTAPCPPPPPPPERPAAAAELEALGGVFDSAKQAVVFQRYCHVYRQGELRALIESFGSAVRVVDDYYDTGNWCIQVEKVA